MPITVDALILALNAGVREYNTDAMGLTNTPGSILGTPTPPNYNKLGVQIYGTSVTAAQNLHSTNAITNARFTAAANTGDAAPNFKVKSYLDNPVVCSVGTSGSVGKIAFYLLHQNASGNFLWDHTSETTAYTHGFPNGYASIIPYATAEGDILKQADVFMVITVSPAIAVTAGGYLTVKGWASGVSGSESFTYVTLQSGS